MIYVVVCQTTDSVSIVAVAHTASAAIHSAQSHACAMGMWRLAEPSTPRWGGDEGENMWIEQQEPVDSIIDEVAALAEEST